MELQTNKYYDLPVVGMHLINKRSAQFEEWIEGFHVKTLVFIYQKISCEKLVFLCHVTVVVY